MHIPRHRDMFRQFKCSSILVSRSLATRDYVNLRSLSNRQIKYPPIFILYQIATLNVRQKYHAYGSTAGQYKGYTEEANVRPLVHVTGTGKVEKNNTGLHEMLESCEVDHNKVHDMDSNELRRETTPKFWETESSELQQITDVQGRLKENIAFWKAVLNAPPPVLDCIKDGLPLKFIPPAYSQHNHKSATTHSEFVSEAIDSLVKNRCITLVDDRPYICSPLSVVSNLSGKLRLVLNLKYLNQYLHVLIKF